MDLIGFFPLFQLHSVQLTAKAPENWWLEDYLPFGKALFSGAMLALGRGIDPLWQSLFAFVFFDSKPIASMYDVINLHFQKKTNVGI